MYKVILSFFRQLIFWVLFFNFTRLVFLLYYSGIISAEGIRLTEILGVFSHSFKLDLATACYFMIFPFLVTTLYGF